MSYLTKDQLENYLKNLGTKAPKPTSLSPQPTNPAALTVPPNSPNQSNVAFDSEERAESDGPLSLSVALDKPPPTTTLNTSQPVDANPWATSESSSPPTISSSIPVPHNTPVVTTNSSPSSSVPVASSNQYRSLDDLVNDLSYPIATKLSFEQTNSDSSSSHETNDQTQDDKNKRSSNDFGVKTAPRITGETTGNYVLSAAFRSYNSAARSGGSKPLPIKQQQSSPSSSKSNSPPSTISHTQRPPKSQQSSPPAQQDPYWNARYDEAQQKFPAVEDLDEKDPKPGSPPQSPHSLSVDREQAENNTEDARSIASEHSLEIHSDGEVSHTEIPPEKSYTATEEIEEDNKNAKEITNESRFSAPVDSNNCAGCGKPITGNTLTAMGRRWHPDHFGCKHCGIPLEHVAFFEKDGDPYCHLDYHELFSPRCGYCNTPIEGDCIKAMGKAWHPGHFFCRECSEPFKDGGFMVHDGYAYCKKDWMSKFAPKCGGCKKPIQDEYINALGGMWHRGCFVCTACEKPFNSSYYHVHKDKPYCDKHYRVILTLKE